MTLQNTPSQRIEQAIQKLEKEHEYTQDFLAQAYYQTIMDLLPHLTQPQIETLADLLDGQLEDIE